MADVVASEVVRNIGRFRRASVGVVVEVATPDDQFISPPPKRRTSKRTKRRKLSLSASHRRSFPPARNGLSPLVKTKVTDGTDGGVTSGIAPYAAAAGEIVVVFGSKLGIIAATEAVVIGQNTVNDRSSGVVPPLRRRATPARGPPAYRKRASFELPSILLKRTPVVRVALATWQVGTGMCLASYIRSLQIKPLMTPDTGVEGSGYPAAPVPCGCVASHLSGASPS